MWFSAVYCMESLNLSFVLLHLDLVEYSFWSTFPPWKHITLSVFIGSTFLWQVDLCFRFSFPHCPSTKLYMYIYTFWKTELMQMNVCGGVCMFMLMVLLFCLGTIQWIGWVKADVYIWKHTLYSHTQNICKHCKLYLLIWKYITVLMTILSDFIESTVLFLFIYFLYTYISIHCTVFILPHIQIILMKVVFL